VGALFLAMRLAKMSEKLNWSKLPAKLVYLAATAEKYGH
jgi:hypothetical protein